LPKAAKQFDDERNRPGLGLVLKRDRSAASGEKSMKLAVVAFAVATFAPFVLTGELQAQPLPSEYPNVTNF
jgi:hypothetical protein